jgi:Domain of Unknown Function (DUF1080)
MRIAAISIILATSLWGCAGEPMRSMPTGVGDETGGAGDEGGKGGSTTTGGKTGTGGSVTSTGGATGSTGGSTGGGSGGSTETPADAGPPSTPDAGPVEGPPGSFPLCPKCKQIFDGKTLDGWEQSPAGSFEVKDGAIASTGKGAHAWTKEDYGDFRIFFQVKQISGDHKPCTTLFCTRPAAGKAPTRGLSGIQFQPPLGGSWDYRPGKNSGPDTTHWMYPNPRPMFDVKKWHRCEILARASTGEFRGACCEIEGKDSCKGQEVLHYKDATAGKKGPFALMMHNGGLFDLYKDIWIETDPVGDELVSTK